MGLALVDIFIILVFVSVGGFANWGQLEVGEWYKGFKFGCLMAVFYNLLIILIPNKPHWMFSNWFKRNRR